MKLGPVHVVTQQTMDTMQAQRQQLEARLEQATAQLAQRQAERAGQPPPDECAVPRPYLHSAVGARLAPIFLLPPDPDTPRARAAVSRIIAAYQQAREDFVPAQPCMWEYIAQKHVEFVAALNLGDEERVGESLRAFFRTDLIWGLGMAMGHAVPDTLGPRERIVQIVCADQLRGLAEAVGVARLTNSEQNLDEYRRALDVDLDTLFLQTERTLGRELSCPQVGGAYGCELAGRRTTPDFLYHAYTVERLHQLGASPAQSVAEIGGGYGCLAYQFARAGFTDYAIYDLPWVNALQGYYLLMTLPEGTVRLYGETGGSVAVLPGWCFEQRAPRSADWVINVNSLPEMGRSTASGYLAQIARVLRGRFLSINQEAKMTVLEYGPQNCVAELVAEIGGLRRTSRGRYWMRNGYVEEVYEAE
jgi:putative sugar O-methyltransferase